MVSWGTKELKDHGHEVSAYLRESVNSVGVVKVHVHCKRRNLNTKPSVFKIDYTYTEKYPDHNVVTMAV